MLIHGLFCSINAARPPQLTEQKDTYHLDMGEESVAARNGGRKEERRGGDGMEIEMEAGWDVTGER